jgi:uncharacterized protein (TIGR03067 family)
MKTCLALLIAGCLLGDTQKQETKTEANLEGTWTIKKLSVRGEESALPEEAVVEFANELMSMKMMRNEIRLGKYTIDTSKKPAEMDIVRQEGEQKGMTVKAIFSLDGDNLKICLAEAPSGARPMDFKIKEGDRSVYMELKRDKK